MPEQVRVYVLRQPLGARMRGHAQLHGACAQRPAVARDEQRLAVRTSQRRALLEPMTQRLDRFAADRGDALLAALADDPCAALVKIQIPERKSGQLSEPQTARIEQFHEREVA